MKCRIGAVFAIYLVASSVTPAHADPTDKYIRRLTGNMEQACDAIAHTDLQLKCLNSLTQLKKQELERLQLLSCLNQRSSYEWVYSQIAPYSPECVSVLSAWDKSHPEDRARELKLLEPLK